MLADVGERSGCQFGVSTTQKRDTISHWATEPPKKSLALYFFQQPRENKIHLTNPQTWEPHNLRNSQWTPHHLPTLVDGYNPFIPSYFACRRHDRIGFRETSLAQKIRSGHQCVDCFTMHPSRKEHKRITYYSIYIYIYIYIYNVDGIHRIQNR